MATETSQGTKLEMQAAGGGATWTEVGEITDIDGVGLEQAVLDATNLRSTARRRRGGRLVDAGKVTLRVNHDAADAGQDMFRAAVVSGDVVNFKITLPDEGAVALAFAGVASSWKTTEAVGAKITAAASIDVDGTITGF